MISNYQQQPLQPKLTPGTARLPSHRRVSIPQPSPLIPSLSDAVIETIYDQLRAANSPEKIEAAIKQILEDSGYMERLKQRVLETTRQVMRERRGGGGGGGGLVEDGDQNRKGIFGQEVGVDEEIMAKVAAEARKGIPEVLSSSRGSDSEASGELVLPRECVEESLKVVRHELWRGLDIIGVDS